MPSGQTRRNPAGARQPMSVFPGSALAGTGRTSFVFRGPVPRFEPAAGHLGFDRMVRGVAFELGARSIIDGHEKGDAGGRLVARRGPGVEGASSQVRQWEGDLEKPACSDGCPSRAALGPIGLDRPAIPECPAQPAVRVANGEANAVRFQELQREFMALRGRSRTCSDRQRHIQPLVVEAKAHLADHGRPAFGLMHGSRCPGPQSAGAQPLRSSSCPRRPASASAARSVRTRSAAWRPPRCC